MIGHPRIFPVKVAFHGEIGPIAQLLLDIGACVFRLEPERMSAEVEGFFAACRRRHAKAFAEMCEWIARVHLIRECLTGLEDTCIHKTSSGVSWLRMS